MTGDILNIERELVMTNHRVYFSSPIDFLPYRVISISVISDCPTLKK